jgi:hypothetical protein
MAGRLEPRDHDFEVGDYLVWSTPSGDRLACVEEIGPGRVSVYVPAWRTVHELKGRELHHLRRHPDMRDGAL